jgi:HK97 family phage portal protein
MASMVKLTERVRAALKAFATGPQQFPQQQASWGRLFAPRTAVDYVREAGDPRHNSAVVACLSWMVDSFQEAPLTIFTTESGKRSDAVENHPLVGLVRRPNQWYSGRELWDATIGDLKLDGNAYWRVVRNRLGTPIEIYWLPASLVEPKWDERDPTSYLTHYEFKVGQREIDYAPEDIVHFREGMDPTNLRKGFSRFRAGLREVFVDNEAALHVASILRGIPVAGMVMSPDPSAYKDGNISLTREQADEMKALATSKFTGDRRGEPMIHSIPLKVQELGSYLSKLDTRDIRRIPEERIAALFKIPPGVVKLGAGLDRNTYNNAETEQEQAWRNAIIPLQSSIADVLAFRLLPMFEPRPESLVLDFDVSQINALQEDADARAMRLNALWQTDAITRKDIRSALGYEAQDADDVYRTEWLRSIPFELPATEEPQTEPAPAKSMRFKAAVPKLSVQEQADKFRLTLIRREASAINQVEAAYLMAEGAIRKRLKELEERMRFMTASGIELSESVVARQQEFRDLLDAIERHILTFSATAGETTAENQALFLRLGIDHSKKLAEAAGAEAFVSVRIAALDSLIGFASDGTPLADLFAELGPDMSAQARTAIFSGVLAGENPRQIASRLDGPLGSGRARALNVARTESLRAYREAARKNYEANADILQEQVWYSAVDERTCPACWAMHGTRHPLGAILDGHPQCRCTMIPVVKGEPYDGETGAELFERLGAEEQEQILGPSIYELYQAGDVSISDLAVQESHERWGTMRRPATAAEVLAGR